MPDGSVRTGYYSDWSQMSNDDKQTVLDTRKKNKGKSPKGCKVPEVGTKLKDKVSNGRAQAYHCVPQQG